MLESFETPTPRLCWTLTQVPWHVVVEGLFQQRQNFESRVFDLKCLFVEARLIPHHCFGCTNGEFQTKAAYHTLS